MMTESRQERRRALKKKMQPVKTITTKGGQKVQVVKSTEYERIDKIREDPAFPAFRAVYEWMRERPPLLGCDPFDPFCQHGEPGCADCPYWMNCKDPMAYEFRQDLIERSASMTMKDPCPCASMTEHGCPERSTCPDWWVWNILRKAQRCPECEGTACGQPLPSCPNQDFQDGETYAKCTLKVDGVPVADVKDIEIKIDPSDYPEIHGDMRPGNCAGTFHFKKDIKVNELAIVIDERSRIDKPKGDI